MGKKEQLKRVQLVQKTSGKGLCYVTGARSIETKKGQWKNFCKSVGGFLRHGYNKKILKWLCFFFERRFQPQTACDMKKACPKKSWPLLTYEKHQIKYN